jgi:hypothetical protein
MHLCMSNKRLQQLLFLVILLMAVKIQQVINAQAMGRSHKTIYRYIRLKGTRSADPDDIERGQFAFDLPGFKINIGKGVQYIDDDNDIIGPDAG